jgi:hypothetical protein
MRINAIKLTATGSRTEVAVSPGGGRILLPTKDTLETWFPVSGDIQAVREKASNLSKTLEDELLAEGCHSISVSVQFITSRGGPLC